MENKAREIRLRNWAKRLGLRLHKSKRQRWSVDDHLGYMIIDNDRNTIVQGQRFELTFDDIEKFLQDYENKLKQ